MKLEEASWIAAILTIPVAFFIWYFTPQDCSAIFKYLSKASIAFFVSAYKWLTRPVSQPPWIWFLVFGVAVTIPFKISFKNLSWERISKPTSAMVNSPMIQTPLPATNSATIMPQPLVFSAFLPSSFLETTGVEIDVGMGDEKGLELAQKIQAALKDYLLTTKLVTSIATFPKGIVISSEHFHEAELATVLLSIFSMKGDTPMTIQLNNSSLVGALDAITIQVGGQ